MRRGGGAKAFSRPGWCPNTRLKSLPKAESPVPTVRGGDRWTVVEPSSWARKEAFPHGR